MTTSRRCYIVTLNWNGWRDTLVCLESILRLAYPDFVVVVCDNASTDDSLERIRAWSRGDLDVLDDTPPEVRALAWPPAPKPVRLMELTREEAERGVPCDLAPRTVVLVSNGRNDGCAKGLNVGVRFSVARRDCAFVWLLNHDTVVERSALDHLVGLVESDPGIGLAGSTVRFAWAPRVTQALGGATFNFWFATGHPIGFLWPASRSVDPAWVARRLRYVAGTSLLATRRLLETVGPIPEHFFLYFEEISWACEIRGRFRLGFAPASMVYHREGAVTGSRTVDPDYGGFADGHLLRDRLVFARIYTPWAVPTVLLGLAFVLVESVVLGRWRRARLLLSPAFWRDATRAGRQPATKPSVKY